MSSRQKLRLNKQKFKSISQKFRLMQSKRNLKEPTMCNMHQGISCPSLIGAHDRVQSCLEFVRRLTRWGQSFLSMLMSKCLMLALVLIPALEVKSTNKIYQHSTSLRANFVYESCGWESFSLGFTLGYVDFKCLLKIIILIFCNFAQISERNDMIYFNGNSRNHPSSQAQCGMVGLAVLIGW